MVGVYRESLEERERFCHSSKSVTLLCVKKRVKGMDCLLIREKKSDEFANETFEFLFSLSLPIHSLLKGGPVILVQLENEYDMVSSAYGDEGAKYIQWTSNLRISLDIPVYS